MITFRRAPPILGAGHSYTDAEIRWFWPARRIAQLGNPKTQQFACVIDEDEQRALCLMFNAGAAAVDFALTPVLSGARWHVAVDTSWEAPRDLFAAGEDPLWEEPRTYHLRPRASAILLVRGQTG